MSRSSPPAPGSPGRAVGRTRPARRWCCAGRPCCCPTRRRRGSTGRGCGRPRFRRRSKRVGRNPLLNPPNSSNISWAGELKPFGRTSPVTQAISGSANGATSSRSHWLETTTSSSVAAMTSPRASAMPRFRAGLTPAIGLVHDAEPRIVEQRCEQLLDGTPAVVVVDHDDFEVGVVDGQHRPHTTHQLERAATGRNDHADRRGEVVEPSNVPAALIAGGWSRRAARRSHLVGAAESVPRDRDRRSPAANRPR